MFCILSEFRHEVWKVFRPKITLPAKGVKFTKIIGFGSLMQS